MMKLDRWTPRTTETRSNPRTLDQMFDDLWQSFWTAQPAPYASDTTRPVMRPPMDVIEREDSVIVRMDLPGLTPDNVQVEVEGGVLTVSGEMGDTVESEGERYHYRERCRGAFKRSLRLAETIDVEHIEATFENGVLNLSLPKLAAAQPRRIRVETA